MIMEDPWRYQNKRRYKNRTAVAKQSTIWTSWPSIIILTTYRTSSNKARLNTKKTKLYTIISSLIYRDFLHRLRRLRRYSPRCKSCIGNHPHPCSPHRLRTLLPLNNKNWVAWVKNTRKFIFSVANSGQRTCWREGILHKDEYGLLCT